MKEVKSVPNLIYAMEQYERYLIQLSKKSKVRKTWHFKVSCWSYMYVDTELKIMEMQVLYNGTFTAFRVGRLVFICWENLVWSLSYSHLGTLGCGLLSVNVWEHLDVAYPHVFTVSVLLWYLDVCLCLLTCGLSGFSFWEILVFCLEWFVRKHAQSSRE